MIFSLVAMIRLEKCCITSAYLQWLCHSGERAVAPGPLVIPCHIIVMGYFVISVHVFARTISDRYMVFIHGPASVAQLDVPSDWRPGGHGFIPRRGRQYSFEEIGHKIFSTVILSLPLIQEGQLSVSGERMCTILVNRLED